MIKSNNPHLRGGEKTLQRRRRNTTEVVSVFLGGKALRPPAPPPMPPSSFFFFVVSCFRFCPLWFLCVGVNKGHDVNELVNKLSFHNASIIQQNGKSPRKMEG